jgi:hypothetical protein
MVGGQLYSVFPSQRDLGLKTDPIGVQETLFFILRKD